MNYQYLSLIEKLSREDDKSNKKTVFIALGIGVVVVGYMLYHTNQMQRREIGRLQVDNDRFKSFNANLTSNYNSLKQDYSKLKNTNDRLVKENLRLNTELDGLRKINGNDCIS